MTSPEHAAIQAILAAAVEESHRNREGDQARYIPELASVSVEQTSAAVKLADGTLFSAGDATHEFTFQRRDGHAPRRKPAKPSASHSLTRLPAVWTGLCAA